MKFIKDIHKKYSDDKLFIDYDRIRCEESFPYFLEQAWPYLDPGSDYMHNWHIDAICEHMEAVKDGYIRRMIINVPPRTSKSSIVSIAFPAWVWIQNERKPLSGPNVQFLCGTYGHPLSKSHGGKFKNLLNSHWFQERWGHRFNIMTNTNLELENDKGGVRWASTPDSGTTGKGGNILLLDDPHNVKEASSEAERTKALEWYDQALSNRFNNPKKSALILVMQRVHVEDMTGHFLTKEMSGMVHLFLPMEFMPDRKCCTIIGWEDPRSEPGELLVPNRMGPEQIIEYKRDMGSYGYVGQYQQMPVVTGGGIIKADDWGAWEKKELPGFDQIIASLDPAYTDKQENDFSACTIWGVFKDEANISRALMLFAWEERLKFNDLVEKVRKTIKGYKVDTMLVEAKASGLCVIQELDRLLKNTSTRIIPVDPRVDKIARAHSVSGLFEAGYIFAPRYDPDDPDSEFMDWAAKVIYQCADFPKSSHDDLVDSVTQAVRYLRDTILETREDRQVALQRQLTYTKPRQSRREHGI